MRTIGYERPTSGERDGRDVEVAGGAGGPTERDFVEGGLRLLWADIHSKISDR